ncbi:MAG: IclR family transcriptional regulator [Proteobacteria bacterium]|nr:MAG: IclR family transcriptional regulator [Pseudomonadota bacterium]
MCEPLAFGIGRRKRSIAPKISIQRVYIDRTSPLGHCSRRGFRRRGPGRPEGDRMSGVARHGVQSIETGMRLLDVFAATGAGMPLSALASAARMNPSKAHRYLVSLIRAGYVEQDQATGHYHLGARSLSVGLAALRQLDVVREGEQLMNELRDATGHTVSMAVWSNQGSTVVRVAELGTSVMVTVRVGSVVPLLNSASGHLFLAFLPRRTTQERIAAELARPSREDLTTMEQVDALAAEVRSRRMSINNQTLNAGILSLAAPVFDHRNEIACTLSLVELVGVMDLSFDGPAARSLAAATRRLSERLGASAPP